MTSGTPHFLMRIVAALVVVATIAVAIRAGVFQRLDGARLLNALTTFADAARTFLASGIGLATAGFMAGLALGCLVATWWVTYRFRSRSLLLLDPRRADMSFLEGVDHVRRQSGSPQPRVDQAATSIVEAAARGRLSLWQQSGTNVLRRIPPRQVRQAGARLAMFVGTAKGESLPGIEFRLFRNEVETLWPARRQLTIGSEEPEIARWPSLTPSVVAHLRRSAKNFIKLK